MTPIKFHCISRKQAPHAGCQWPFLSLTKQMKMIRQESPRIDFHCALFRQFSQTADKIYPIAIIEEDLSLLNSSSHHMVQNPGGVQSRCSWHDLNMTGSLFFVKHFLHGRPPFHVPHFKLNRRTADASAPLSFLPTPHGWPHPPRLTPRVSRHGSSDRLLTVPASRRPP